MKTKAVTYRQEKNKQLYVKESQTSTIAYQQDEKKLLYEQRKIKTPEEILYLFKNKAIDKEWSFEGYKPSDTGKWTHSYHRYPAKFIPQLVEKLIDEYVFTKNAHINFYFPKKESC